MLRRAPSLTDQVKNHLKDMIIRGEFSDGRVPPEMELAEALGVSRTTIRDALSPVSYTHLTLPTCALV